MTAYTFSVPDAAEVRAWREPVLRRLLTGAALVGPLAMLLPSALQSAYRTPLDLALLGGAGLLPVVMRFAPVGSWTARAAGVVAALFVAGAYAFARAGFAAGGMAGLMTATLLASIFSDVASDCCFGRPVFLRCCSSAGSSRVAASRSSPPVWIP